MGMALPDPVIIQKIIAASHHQVEPGQRITEIAN
jgi:hypothetical protein